MNSMNKTVQAQSFQSIMTGLLYSLISMGLLTILVSLFLLLTNLKEGSLSTHIYAIHGLSLVVGGFITGKRMNKKGWYYGGILGVVYSIVICLVGFLGFNTAFTLTTLLMMVLSFTVGALGGIVGVNAKK